MTTIPASVLDEARRTFWRELHSSTPGGALEETLAVLARHWPVATPDRYTAGFRDGVEKAAEWHKESEKVADATAVAGEGTSQDREAVRMWLQNARWHNQAAAAIRALAPPDDALIVGRLRWDDGPGSSDLLFCGFPVGHISTDAAGRWWAFCHHRARYLVGEFGTPEAARAALVVAVRREVEGGDHG